MANTSAPFGFQPVGHNGGMPNFAVRTLRIISSNSTPIYKGDPVEWQDNTPTGYIKLAATADIPGSYNNSLAGIFLGCKYLSTSQKRTVWSPYWPGADTAYDVEAFVVTDPMARFKVMANTGFTITSRSIWTSSPVGRLCTFNTGSGSATTGLSGAYVETLGTTGEFMVVDVVTDPPGGVVNGTDPTSSYNHVIVGFNAQWLRTNGASTGIS